NVQGGHENDQPNSDESNHSFQAERSEKRPVLFYPTSGHEPLAGRLLQLLCNGRGAVNVVNLELEHGDDVAQPEEALCIRKANKSPRSVVLIEARLKNPCNPKPYKLRRDPVRGQLSLRAGDRHN